MADKPITEIPIFFVLGRPRSGTTLLRTLFDAHPNVKIPIEYPFFFYLYARYRKEGRIRKEEAGVLFEELRTKKVFNRRYFDYMKMDEEAFLHSLEAFPGGLSPMDFYKLVNYHSGSLFDKEEIRWIGDKNPIYSIYPQKLLELFPGSRFLCIVRDYRDNFVSMRKFEFEALNTFLLAYRWKYVIRLFLKMKKKYPDRFYIIRYEELVSKPEEHVKKLCEYLELPFHQEVLDFYRKSSEAPKYVPEELMMKYHKSLTEPISTDKINLWKTELTPKQIRALDFTVGKLAEKMEYERQYRSFYPAILLHRAVFSAYGFLLFRLMYLGSKLPFSWYNWFSERLPKLAKFYFRMKKKKDQ
ncbi:MAG TPA: sulfotransferase [Bacteroidales bacterium]|nr:sulfotransferase [Bacteroidales bacterium]